MASVNKVILVGNLGADPESRFAPSGDAICNIRLATTESWRDKQSGDKKEATEWHRVTFYGKLAEIAGQYLRKGSQVSSGQLALWQDQVGRIATPRDPRGRDEDARRPRRGGEQRSQQRRSGSASSTAA